jgi:hypothetical protein
MKTLIEYVPQAPITLMGISWTPGERRQVSAPDITNPELGDLLVDLAGFEPSSPSQRL